MYSKIYTTVAHLNIAKIKFIPSKKHYICRHPRYQNLRCIYIYICFCHIRGYVMWDSIVSTMPMYIRPICATRIAEMKDLDGTEIFKSTSSVSNTTFSSYSTSPRAPFPFCALTKAPLRPRHRARTKDLGSIGRHALLSQTGNGRVASSSSSSKKTDTPPARFPSVTTTTRASRAYDKRNIKIAL